ncbi:hypothetical protein [Nonomuraea cavernae]|nr:hypothetical protein [Nonomuraea cavernae]MCA2189346.1 hypothetical protein [Nonomuraea cavernae]
MNDTAIDYADFAEFDRRQRGIERHVLAAFLGGLVVGLIGMLMSGRGPGWVEQIYHPYAYFALTLVVGATASGFGWALLTTFLAAVSMLVAAMGGSVFRGDLGFDVVGDSPAGLNWTLVLLVGLGLLAYLTRRRDRWGDLAAGLVGAVLLTDVVDRATPGFIGEVREFWPVPALVIGSLAVILVIVVRRGARGRVRALAVTTTLAGLAAFLLAGPLSGWFPPLV